jgi:predicted RNase H-like nuclease (RuvC/YqgF family)
METTPETVTQRPEDLVIAQFADEAHELRERVTELEADNRTLRETLHEAVSMLYRTNVQLDRAKQTVITLHQTVRELRELQRAA